MPVGVGCQRKQVLEEEAAHQKTPVKGLCWQFVSVFGGCVAIMLEGIARALAAPLWHAD